jgi:uncharacterized protein YdhG (YjbR/CyaY superfamily)
MSSAEVDDYLAGVDEPGRSTLETVRRSILAVLPGAEEGISYGMPAFRVGGKVVAGFAAFKNHLAYLPHSGEVLARLGNQLDGYEHTSGSLHFPIDEPLPDDLVRSLVNTKLEILSLTATPPSPPRAHRQTH